MKQTGRPLTTGRYETRKELVERVLHLYYKSKFNVSMNRIASICRISSATVCAIVEGKK